MSRMKDIIDEHMQSSSHLSKKHIHPRLSKMFELAGINIAFTGAEGYWLYDDEGNKYLDLLAGGGVYMFGRNHPRVNQALQDVISSGLPNMSVVNASVLGGLLAERLLEMAGPGFTKVQYSNSGAESNEVAIRFSRYCTRRRRYLFLEGAFHGRTFGAISMCGFDAMKEGMEPRMPTCTPIPPNDIEALRRELSKGDVAAFFYEKCQGMTLDVVSDEYLREARRLCTEYGTLLCADEVQTGLARLGDHWFGFQRAGIVPDMVSVSKILSGGAVPVAATLIGEHVYKKVFEDFKSGPIYFSTFAENNLAMAAGITTLEILDELDAPTRAAEVSKRFREGLNDIATRYDVIDRIAGEGLMIGIYFKESSNALLKAQQRAMGIADSGAFGAAVNVDMFVRHKIIVQIPGPGLSAIKILPQITITDDDIQFFLDAFEETIANMYSRAGGPALSLGKAVVKDALRTVRGRVPGLGNVPENGAGTATSPKKEAPA